MCDFFFSSRRRHTRSKRDWSSDVCSSDLRRPGRRRMHGERARSVAETGSSCRRRSEERRVGKECRARWSPHHKKKKKEKNAFDVLQISTKDEADELNTVNGIG